MPGERPRESFILKFFQPNCPFMTPIRCLAARPFCYLRFHIQDGDHALRVDLPDRLQPGSVHGVLVAAVLQVVVVAYVLHHLVVRHKVVVLSVLLVLLRRPSRVCAEGTDGAGTKEEVRTRSHWVSGWVTDVVGVRVCPYGGWGRRSGQDVW